MKSTIAYAVYCNDEIIDDEGNNPTKKTIPLMIGLSKRLVAKDTLKEYGWEVKKVKITPIK